MNDDRAFQDSIIRLLADAPFRHALTHVDEGSAYGGMTAHQVEGIRAGDARRVDRFAKFLARQYYRDRIFLFHKYSRALARFTGRSPEAVVHTPEFDNLLPTIILGSRSTARDVSRLVQAYLADARGAPPYAAELARYENAQLLAESGPRVPPRHAAARPRAPRGGREPRRRRAPLQLEPARGLPAAARARRRSRISRAGRPTRSTPSCRSSSCARRAAA